MGIVAADAGGEGNKVPKVGAIANWFGSNRMLAENVGRLLKGCSWVGVPFAGGMCELAHIDANVTLVSDLHRHVINLASVIADEGACEFLATKLNGTPFHPDTLSRCQRICRQIEENTEEYCPVIADASGFSEAAINWAYAYFVASWMSRAGTAGTENEFDGSMSIRWKAGGGDSAVRFRSAIDSLHDWQKIMRRCTFVCLDVFEFLDQARIKGRDCKKNGLYLDAPFPVVGDAYKHKFTIQNHRDLANKLLVFSEAKIVCRFYDTPLIRELYPEPAWKWHTFTGRKQTNGDAPEVLLTRNA